ncbi:MAG TPA: ankyrin repeat domain-containing protein [Mycobacteriales bacterium]|nr:ankyrin repeat domain-containing protein [Mycobacteriales bacterium]
MPDIFAAVGAGDPALVDELLRGDRRLAFARTDDGVSVVLWAMYVGQPRLATLLAHAKRDLDIFEAAAVGVTERLGELVDEDVRRASGWTTDGFSPLHLAAFFGHPDAARRLITAGADVDAEARNANRAAPLHSAAAGAHPECVRVLLDAGADVNAREQGGWTPLHSAARAGDSASVALLVSAGADLAAVDDEGHLPVDLATGIVRDRLAALANRPSDRGRSRL